MLSDHTKMWRLTKSLIGEPSKSLDQACANESNTFFPMAKDKQSGKIKDKNGKEKNANEAMTKRIRRE
ncbi:hypothetical protein DPMN_112562 [Dreissena polymorpha]|uniref:Uncharacterized protein n=1 Tax=Dreissena polymorpha TaxID=45954 RepID=A0A9D4KFX9_DREPO|nr:hypothetical protein DPMN_112562 [Dreissena polymorpha]